MQIPCLIESKAQVKQEARVLIQADLSASGFLNICNPVLKKSYWGWRDGSMRSAREEFRTSSVLNRKEANRQRIKK